MAIRVIVLLDVGGTNTNVRHLGSVTIANDGTGTDTQRNYQVIQHGKDARRIVTKGRIEGHRSKDVSIWKLVSKALGALGHG